VLELVISGGQAGADQAAWRAARACGLKTAGMMPAGFRTLTGDRPEFADLYGATEHRARQWEPRTEDNVVAADATLCFNRGSRSPGTRLAQRVASDRRKPFLIIDPEKAPPPLYVAGQIAQAGYQTVNCCGNREPEPDHWVESYLVQVFAMLVLNGLAVADPPWPGVEAVLCEMSVVAGPAAATAALRGDYKARPR
jgi:hypothetical protein